MIYIPFKDSIDGIGGPSTFMRHLRSYLIKTDFPFIEDEDEFREADSIFFPISYSSRILKYFKKNRLPIIQRLDGVYYPSKHGIKYLYYNRNIKLDYLKYSDFIIFQSKYSWLECFTMMGEIPKEKYRIIYNGTDKSVFYPGHKEFNGDKIVFAATGSFRNRDMVEPVVLALDELKKDCNIEFKIIGPILSPDVDRLAKRDYIRCLGRMDKEGIAEELRKTDILIHCQLNPACPNSVIEAASCGLPVVGFDSGAMKEVLHFCPELLAHVSGDVFQKYGDFKYKRLLEKIVMCIEEYDKYRLLFLKHAGGFDSEDMSRQYVEVLKKEGSQ